MDDDIRRQRLARFAQIAQNEQQRAPQQDSRSSGTTPASRSPQNSPSALPVASSSSATSKAAPATQTSPAASTTSPKPAPKLASKSVPEPAPLSDRELAEYESRAVASVLQVTLSPQDKALFYMGDCIDETMGANSENPMFAASDMDMYMYGLVEKLKATPGYNSSTVFTYLFGCWNRATRMARAAAAHPDKAAVVEMVKDYLGDCGELVGDSEDGSDLHSNLGEALYKDPDSVPWDFVERIMHDESSAQMIAGNAVKALTLKFFTQRHKSKYHVIYNLIDRLFSIKIVARSYGKDREILDPPDPQPLAFMALNSVLGIFVISPLDQPFCNEIFPNPSVMTREQINRTIADTQPEALLIMDRQFSIAEKLVRGSPESRDYFMKLLTRLLERNYGRMAMQVDKRTVTPDGIMLNITYMLIKFCMPFVDFTGQKLGKISLDFLRSPEAMNLSQETRLVADADESAQWASNKAASSNFVSQVFFLATAYLQYGAAATIQAEKILKRQIGMFQDRLRQIEERQQSSNIPVAMLNVVRQRMQTEFNSIKAQHAALGCVLFSEAIMTPIYEFATFVLVFTMHSAQSTYPPQLFAPGAGVESVPAEPSPSFRVLPEYIVEAPVAVLVYIMQNITGIVRRDVRIEQLEAVIFFLLCPQYIKNPYLKSRLVELPFYGCMDQRTMMGGSIDGFFRPAFATHPLVQQYLLRALVKLYVDMEQTGRSAQFYEKFTTRELISYIIDVLWDYPVYRLRLEEESRDHPEFFERFVALLLNDSTYLLDEALGKLQEIRRLQQAIEDPNRAPPANNNGRDEDDDDDDTEEGQLAAAERQVKSYLHLGSKTVDLLSRFTSSVPELFLTKEIIDRLASMLNYNLVALVGPKCGELVVKNPQEYGWNPRDLLSRIAQVYLNLRKHEEFLRALVRDGRSFSVDLFRRAGSILRKRSLVSPQALKEWDMLTAATEQAEKAEADAEAELGEIPDEFLDPLMYTLMENPVILPTSRVTMDLSTIKAHLLSDPTDPFNRTPLRIEDVEPNTEMAARIKEFKQQRKDLRSHSTT